MRQLRIVLVILCSGMLLLLLLLAGLGRQVSETLLNAEFFAAEIEQADVIGAASQLLVEKIDPQTKEFAGPVISRTLEQQRATIQREMRSALTAGFSYLRGERDTLQVSVDLEPVVQDLLGNLRAQLRDHPPAQMKELSASEKEQFVTDFEENVIRGIIRKGETLKFDEGMIPADSREQVRQTREAIRTFLFSYKVVIGAAGVLALIVGWLGSLRWLGAVLALAGGALLVPTFFTGRTLDMIPAESVARLPATLRSHLPVFLHHLMAPLRTSGWAGLAAGAGLMAAGFLVERRRKGPPAAATASSDAAPDGCS